MDKLVNYLLNQIEESGIKGLIPAISAIILALIFISPSYILIFFYERSLFSEYNLIINIMTVLILDTILFLVLFVIGSFRDIKINENGECEDSGKLSKDIVITISLMGGVSVLLTIVYGICTIIKGNSNIAIGVITLAVILVIILVYYILGAVKILKIILKK